MHSVLGRCSFCRINASMRCGMEEISWPEPHRFSTVDWPVKHSNTTVSKPVSSSFGSVGSCQVPLEKRNQRLQTVLGHWFYFSSRKIISNIRIFRFSCVISRNHPKLNKKDLNAYIEYMIESSTFWIKLQETNDISIFLDAPVAHFWVSIST